MADRRFAIFDHPSKTPPDHELGVRHLTAQRKNFWEAKRLARAIGFQDD
jgi:hypothetical protein